MKPEIVHVAPTELQRLVSEFRADFAAEENSLRASLKRRVKMGLLLIKMKQAMAHGEWEGFAIHKLKPASLRTINGWMRLAKQGYAKSPDSMMLDEIDNDIASANYLAERDQIGTECRFEQQSSCVPPTTYGNGTVVASDGSDIPDLGEATTVSQVAPESIPATPPLEEPTNPPPTRQPGDDTETETAAAQEEKAKRDSNGQENFSIRTYNMHLGKAKAEADKFARELGYVREPKPGFVPGLISCPEHAGIQRLLTEAETNMLNWRKRAVPQEQETPHGET